MIVSIHQPQYLPWLPYFEKIAASDLFIVLDSVDFQKNGVQNRNIVKGPQGASWLTVPVRQKLGQKIFEVRINNDQNWRKKHWNSIAQSYAKGAAFAGYREELQDAYLREWELLADLNLHLTKMLLRWMEINTPLKLSSQMSSGGRGSELVLNLLKEVGATRYLSGVGGKGYLDEAAFERAGIEIVYLPPRLPEHYPQLHPKAGFLNDLSVLDLILNCGRQWRRYHSGAAQNGL